MENLYTFNDTARILGVTPRTLTNWRQRGWLLTVTLPSGHQRITASELERLIGEALRG